MVKDEPRLSRVEILGAWLNVWTPPRGAEIPPVPWRRIGVWALGIAIVLGAAVAVGAPLIDESKDRAAAREQRAIDARRTARRARIRAEQQPRFGTIATDGARGAALATVEGAIGRDARARFSERARPATCDPAAGADVAAGRVAYECVSAVRDVVGSGDQSGARGTLGIPYRAVVDFDGGRYAFCKVNPPPGEQVIPDPREVIQIPRACRS